MLISRLVAMVVLCAATLGTSAQEIRVGELSIQDPWARPLPPVADNGAAYLSVINHAMHTDRLVAASTPIAKRVEFHSSVHGGSMVMMKREAAVEITARDTFTMASGGMHLMLVGLKRPLVAGTSFPLTLTFDRAGTTTVTVIVEARTTDTDAPAMQHGAPTTKRGKAAH